MPADRSDRPPTIPDVAALADVSKSLVSLVLVGDPRVSETRRQAVDTAIKELGYRPNLRARALPTGVPTAWAS
jgi:DNA-binding LacI/PurR family transcriptional regulator